METEFSATPALGWFRPRADCLLQKEPNQEYIDFVSAAVFSILKGLKAL